VAHLEDHQASWVVVPQLGWNQRAYRLMSCD